MTRFAALDYRHGSSGPWLGDVGNVAPLTHNRFSAKYLGI